MHFSYGGFWAPLCLLLVSVVLILYRKIYVELVSAIPLNGATYTAMINTSRCTCFVLSTSHFVFLFGKHWFGTQ